jgi:hypothetical protein
MRLFFLLLLSLPAFPQPRLAAYLNLTSKQQKSLQTIETKLNQYVSDRTLRAFQLELEIRRERDRSTLDATAIGTRYVELETICRDARRRYQSAISDARALLAAPQLARLKTLEESLSLLPTVAEADKSKLLDAPGIGPLTIQMGVLNSRPLPGCQSGQAPTVQTRTSPSIPGLDPPPQP